MAGGQQRQPAASAQDGRLAWAQQLQVGFAGPLWPALTLAVAPGQIWAVVGRNGSGKSTLLRALAGLRPCLAGRVGRAGPAAYLSARARVPDDLPARAVDWVADGSDVGLGWLGFGGGRRRRAAASAALDMLQLGELAEVSMHGLSDGQVQRAFVARALAAGPRLLLLDEPSSAMDAAFEAQLVGDVARWCRQQQRAVLWAGHHLPPLLAHASHLVVLDVPGQLAVAGPQAQVWSVPAAAAVLSSLGGSR